MSTLSLNLPNSMYEQLRELAAREDASIDQFATLALAEKMAAIDAADYIAKRAEHGSREKLLEILAAAPDVEPPPEDRVPRKSE